MGMVESVIREGQWGGGDSMKLSCKVSHCCGLTVCLNLLLLTISAVMLWKSIIPHTVYAHMYFRLSGTGGAIPRAVWA